VAKKCRNCQLFCRETEPWNPHKMKDHLSNSWHIFDMTCIYIINGITIKPFLSSRLSTLIIFRLISTVCLHTFKKLLRVLQELNQILFQFWWQSCLNFDRLLVHAVYLLYGGGGGSNSLFTEGPIEMLNFSCVLNTLEKRFFWWNIGWILSAIIFCSMGR
jgi:hypothetical protein